jgi:hypothetical protein
MLATPMNSLPLATATAASASAPSTEATIVGTPASVANGRNPISTRPPIRTATTTASTERRPCSAQ